MPEPQTHKLAKGDTLEGVAKKYRADAKAVWKAPENKALVAKRGKPEALQPGDVLVIPPDPKSVKAAAQKAEQLRRGREAAQQLLATLKNEVARTQRRIKTYEELIEFNKKSAAEIVGELVKVKGDMKRWSDGVDTAATVAQITVSLGQLCAKGYQSTKLTGAALEKLNMELTKDVVAMPVEQLRDVGIKLGGELRDRTDSPLGYLGVVFNSWEKMTSPSFWANTFVQVTQNKKSWSDAVAMDVGEDIDARIKEVVGNFQQQAQKLQQKLAEARTQQGENAKLLAECQTRIRWAEDEARKL